MKKILSWSSLLLFASAMLIGAGCTEEEVAEGAAGVVGGTIASIAGGLIICFWVVAGMIGLFLFVIWIIALVDCSRRKPEEFPEGTGGENAKTLWLVILIATFFVTQLNGIAAIVYYFMVMKKKPIKR